MQRGRLVQRFHPRDSFEAKSNAISSLQVDLGPHRARKEAERAAGREAHAPKQDVGSDTDKEESQDP